MSYRPGDHATLLKCSPNPSGLCMCGCGERTEVAAENDPRWGVVAGEPRRFVHGHNGRGIPIGRDRYIHSEGYVMVRAPGHPRAHSTSGFAYEHILVAERTTGITLPPDAVIHHVNGSPADNRPENLVICENQGYHRHLHQRMRARDACGNPNFVQCYLCRRWSDPKGPGVCYVEHRNQLHHRSCKRSYDHERSREKGLRAVDWRRRHGYTEQERAA